MRPVLLLLAAVALVASAPGLVQAQDPCPNHCTPPEPCGWPPDLRKYPVQWAQFWVGCARGIVGEPVLP